MKRLKILLVLLLSLSLTGCIKEYTITEEKSDAVAEYMAGLLLSYDSNYDQELIPTEETTDEISDDVNVTTDETSEDTTEESTSEESSSEIQDSLEVNEEEATASGENQEHYTLSQVIGETGFTVQYKSYKLVDTYPEDLESSNFTLTLREGYQLLVASFTIKNKSDSKKEINLIKSGITYQLDINSGIVYKPLLTLLENDLQYIDIMINPDKSKNALLIFEVSKDADITDINLIAKKEDKSVTMKLK